jgi:4-hydroxy-2-oxoheptanedioate aldolase
VEGIDACLIGPNDLSNSLGIPGDLLHKRNVEAMLRIARSVRAAGRILGMHGPDQLIDMLLPEGLTLIMSGHDAGLLTATLRTIVTRWAAD